MLGATFDGLGIDCLQSAFSLKIRLVLISASVIANHDVMLLCRSRAWVSRAVTLQRKIRDCSQSSFGILNSPSVRQISRVVSSNF